MAKKKKRPGRHFRRVLLDAFTETDLETWTAGAIDLQAYHDRVYFDLERQRVARHDELCGSLRSIAATSVDLAGWVRVTDWRWNLTPLSSAGSVKGIGGRFNIGAELDRARGQHFACLYLAQNVETAYREYFGDTLDSRRGRLSLQELVLRRESSFTTFALRGRINQVFDLRKYAALSQFASIISEFDVASDTRSFARRLGLAQRPLLSNAKQLWSCFLTAPSNWRREPMWFGIPVASQIFGRFVRDAGFEAIVYPSQRGGDECLAVFPENLVGGDSRIEVLGEVPPGATYVVLDKDRV